MPIEFHALANVSEVAAADLAIPRARALLDAAGRQRDFNVVQLLQRMNDGVPSVECLVVEVECDGVPPKNAFGINYRERLALCVFADTKRLIEVLALRKDFPILMHQNQGTPDAPASLCLYFEPAATVNRTWTPQNFLRRVQWWLEKSAEGSLHPAEQPVEHLFFATKFELVVPWNLGALRADPSLRFVIARGAERADGGFTCFMEAIPKDAAQRAGTAAPIELQLEPVVHGFVERDPQTLGQLADMLTRRGTNLLPALHAALQLQVGDAGLPASANDKFTVILLHIPVSRTEGADSVAVSHRAFVLLTGALELGAAVGALFLHEKRYYKDVLNAQSSNAWHDQCIFPMDVLSLNDAAAARRQSGLSDAGPNGVLIGAGSLGSAMLNLWGRSGWGAWTVIDNDHIKPHNLSRHSAYAQHIGQYKTAVASELHDAATHGASKVTPICADACDFTNAPVASALNSSTLVVDASTTLEYPRAASAVDAFARHISAFVTPSGNASVMLVEDTGRAIRLRSLEAQYYRAVIQNDWGADHLTANGRSFWSGASCRDISMVMPYSLVMGHASTLAEQIQVASASPDASIRVWQRDVARGAVAVHDVQPATERRMQLGEFDLFIDAGAEAQLRDLRASGLPNETGGVLLGYYDFNINAVVIVTCLPAPPDSTASQGAFKRGIAGLADAVNEASRRTAGIVGYIGEWHSHPRGHTAAPSRDDFVQLVHLALGMSDDGLPAVQLIVGEGDMQVLQGTVR